MVSPRIPPLPASGNAQEVQDLIDQATAGMGASQNIFLTMARHPGLMRRFLPYGGKLLVGGRLTARQRELAILRTAWLCRSEYEWGLHVSMGVAAGITREEVRRVSIGPAAEGWAPDIATLLEACDELVADHDISDSTWTAMAAMFDEQQVIELTMLVGNYAMLAGMLNALRVEPEPGAERFDAVQA